MPRPISTPSIVPPVAKEPTLAPSRLKHLEQCPGYITGPGSAAADEGSLLHAVVEAYIGNYAPPAEYDPENREHAGMVDYAVEVYKSLMAEAKPQRVLVEHTLQLPFCARPSRLDLVLLSGDTAVVCDWKFGRNEVDHPSVNHQMRAYAAGLWLDMPGIHTVEVVLAYPRYRKVSRATLVKKDFQDAILSMATTGARCKEWRENLCPGDVCSWCARKLQCPAATSAVNEVFKALGGDSTKLDPHNIDLSKPERLGHMMEAASVVLGWVEDVKKYANHVAIEQGIDIPGYKVCTKQGTQALTDIHLALQALMEIMAENGLGDLDYGLVLDHLKPSPSALSKYLTEAFKAKHDGKPPKGSLKKLEESIEAKWDAMKILHKNAEVYYLRKE